MNPSPLTMWLLVAIATITSILLLPNSIVFASIPVLIPAVIIAIIIDISAFKHHKQAPKPTNDIDALITSGPYKYIRHPFYAADILIAISIAITFPRTDVIVAMIAAIIIFVVWAKREERALHKRFPEYDSYKQRTGMFFPRF